MQSMPHPLTAMHVARVPGEYNRSTFVAVPIIKAMQDTMKKAAGKPTLHQNVSKKLMVSSVAVLSSPAQATVMNTTPEVADILHRHMETP